MLRSLTCVGVCTIVAAGLAAEIDTTRGDALLHKYFHGETIRLRDACLADVKTLEDWQFKRPQLHTELRDMLGLDPWPAKTDLKPVVTGTIEHAQCIVERLHFQSLPGLYVTANLYRPKEVKEPLPAILYVCGHGKVKKGDISYGNKTHYQHHGAWFARNGYVCLTIDSLQLGEIEGLHHGTHQLGMWWWINRGYTPAGVEAWNCIRALDYLETRPEVDKSRFGVTGRSGGGAYSWWIAALDDRIRAAVPVAGVTDLENHVIDGCVEGHCDCMYFHNTYRWDYPTLCALVAPRPLLISNTDSDGIFPLDGVYRTFEKVRQIYRLDGAAKDKVGLSIGPGGHKDTQDLQIDAFRWFNVHLKGQDLPIDTVAVKLFTPEQLRVFGDQLPADQINTSIQETFVAAAKQPSVPESKEQWESQRTNLLAQLKAKTFRAWPEQAASPTLQPVCDVTAEGVRFRAFDFLSEEPIQLRLYVAHREKLEKAELAVLNVLDGSSWTEFLATYSPAFPEQLKGEALPEANAEGFAAEKKMFESFPWVMAYVAPRGIGPTAFTADAKKRTHVLRRFQLLGQTLEGGQAYDVRRALQSLRSLQDLDKTPVWLQSHRQMAGVALYASLFEPAVARLDLHDLPASHREGPYLFNVQRILDMPQAVAMAAERSKVMLYTSQEEPWQYPLQVAEKLGWTKQLQLRKTAAK